MNGCSDEFTVIDLNLNRSDLEYYKDRIFRMQNLAWVMLICYILQAASFIVMVIWNTIFVAREKKENEANSRKKNEDEKAGKNEYEPDEKPGAINDDDIDAPPENQA